MKKVLVVGLGKSGVSAAKLLAGNDVTAWDSKTEENFDAAMLEELRSLGIKLVFGGEEISGHFDEVVLSPGVPSNHALTKLADRVIGEVELAYENCKGIFAGITGTNGKTTTTTLLGELVQAGNIPTHTCGNIGTPVCDCLDEATEETIMVTELSSFQLETIENFRPRYAAILNLAPDHMDRHGSAEEYYRCKKRIFLNQTEEDYLVYNMDDAETVKAVAEAKSTLVPFTRTKLPMSFADVKDIAYVQDGVIMLRRNGKDHEICRTDELQILGQHNVENALAGAMMASLIGVKPRTIAKVLKNFKAVAHRMEYVRTVNGVRYINDSKGTNPDATIKALQAIETPMILIGGGYEKHSDFHPVIEEFKGKVRYLFLIGQTKERFAQAAIDCGFKDEHIIKCETLEMCIAGAAKLAEKGDTVLLSPACASWGMFKNYEQRGDDFKRIVKEL